MKISLHMEKKKKLVNDVKERAMSKMSWISHLCETGNRKELIEEVGIELADDFLKAHNQMRDNKDNPAYDKLNEIHDEMQKEVKDEQVSSLRLQSKGE
tara:strand:+ start:1339 stop:1632 length:294 start_codon:yes stop_codon:yes gene_type:complete